MRLPSMNCKQVGLMSIVCLITFFVNNSVIVPDIMESRNIITAREMVYDGHWLVPTMNGGLRLEKPPLPTWLTAAAEMIVPDSIALQRAMAGLAAVLLVIYFWKFARRVLRIDPLVPSLLLCTCYNVVLMGRTASWDIYCHAFMMGGIYHLTVAWLAPPRAWRHFLVAGVWTGLSIMSKGPVSLYALFLPFLVSYFCCYRPSTRGKGGAMLVMALVALAVGAWWYAYIRLFYADAMAAMVEKESGSWLSHNVRPWWYYWKFFLETGVWSLLLLTAIFLPLFQRARRQSKLWLFTFFWMFLSLVLLSVLPEKKPRYLLPLLIPASYLMGVLIEFWKASLSRRDVPKADRAAYRINAGMVALAVALLPVAAWIFLLSPGYIHVWQWAVLTLLCVAVIVYIVRSLRSLKPVRLVYGVTALFLGAECFALPLLRNVINNPEMNSISQTQNIKELDGLPFYYNKDVPLRIELVYAAHRKILPLDMSSADSLMQRMPCAVVTRGRVGEELSADLWRQADSLHVGCFDDNSRPKGNRRYSDEFIYHVTILQPKDSGHMLKN